MTNALHSGASTLSTSKLKALEWLLKKQGVEFPSEEFPLRRLGRDTAPLSYAQQRLWFLDKLQPGSVAYNMPTVVRLQGPLRLDCLERSLNEVVRRHEILRTRFQMRADGELEQVVMAATELNLTTVKISGDGDSERLEEANRFALREFERPFDLSSEKLFRAFLLRISDEDQVLAFVIHHIISDAWSQEILLGEIKHFYSAYSNGEQPGMDDLPIQYADFSTWQRAWLDNGVISKQLEYWHRQLWGMKGILELPADHARPPVMSHAGARYHLQMADDLSEQLKRVARSENVSLFMLLLAALEILFWKYTGETDIAIGTPIANRSRPETEKLIGMFVNTLVMRTKIDRDESFLELLRRVKETALGAFSHQDIPFERLVGELHPERDLSRTPLFQVMFDLQNTYGHDAELAGLNGVMQYLNRTETKFDLTMYLNSDETHLRCTAEYRTDLFQERTIRHMCAHFEVLLKGILEDPAQHVVDLKIMTSNEEEGIVVGWNETEEQYEDKSIIELIEEQAEREPEATAVEYEGAKLSYAELNAKANQLARYLNRQGVGGETLVGVCMERSLELVVGLLGILKSGGAYVPLDPGYPAERLKYMREDSGIELMLIQERMLGQWSEAGTGKLICVDRDWEGIRQEDLHNLEKEVDGENLAYAIYTSGSTGKPKGAMNRHAGISNRLQWMQQAYRLNGEDRVLQKTPFSFDVSVWEFFWPLMVGAKLVVAKPGGHQESNYLVETIRDHGVTTVHFVPSMLQAFLEEPGVEKCHGLKRVICSGEALSWELQEKFFALFPGVELHNLYGPTEAAVDVTHWRCDSSQSIRRVPLGRPIGNLKIHILDEEMKVVPAGVSGELYIGGAGLGRGYLNRPELTGEKFVPNPYGNNEGERLYKTGDLGKYRSDGTIEYLGRTDHQVKIRGNRIELGEVETVLRQCGGVKDAAVMVREEREEKRLVGYVVMEEEKRGDGEAENGKHLKEEIRKKLPEYMVPAVVMELKRLPLNENGKVDRERLPHGEWRRSEQYVAPRTGTEGLLAQVWSEVLNVEQVGITDNFFDLGGHSLLALRLIKKIEEEFLRKVPLSLLFENPTIQQLGEVMQQNEPAVSRSCLLPMRRNGSKAPLFFVHPVGGSALSFATLVRLLGADQPFYAFQVIDDVDDDSTDDKCGQLSSIEERASYYLGALQKVQPNGPYWLGGWSFGGYVVYEMARQLAHQGQEIALLLLLDITTKIGRTPDDADDVQLALRLANELKQLAKQPEIVLEAVERLNQEEQLRYILRELVEGKLIDSQTDLKRLYSFMAGIRKRTRALQLYEPRPYPGQITLIRTDDVIGAEGVESVDQTRGWKELSPSVTVYFSPGQHHNMVFMPYAATLARILKECLKHA